MLYPISDEQLKVLAQGLKETLYQYYPVTRDYMRDIYETGARPMEMLQINRWTVINATQVNMQPQKGNAVRVFDKTKLSANLNASIISQARPYNGLSLRQISSVIKKILPTERIQTIKKSAIDYLFRYNRVKELAAAGFTDTQIATAFGWSGSSMAYGYRTTILYSWQPMPPITVAVLIDDAGNIIIDNAGNEISF